MEDLTCKPALRLCFKTDRDLIKFLTYLRNKKVTLNFPGLDTFASEISSETENQKYSLISYKEFNQ